VTPENRRPLRTRDAPWVRRLATRLAEAGVEPDRISQASVGAAIIGFGAFWAASGTGGLAQTILLVIAAAACQARLLCNLLDGMVAVEGGKGGPQGPFWNEAPDRLADVLLLGGAGLAAGAPELGLAAGILALGTAYLREFGRAEGFAPDFSGPMAKPQRMAALTIGTLIAAVYAAEWTLGVTLWIIAAGTAITILRRSMRLLADLNAR
jgi:phosphatidylglycerophosphate synthase